MKRFSIKIMLTFWFNPLSKILIARLYLRLAVRFTVVSNSASEVHTSTCIKIVICSCIHLIVVSIEKIKRARVFT